ncbi:ABC transporter permease [Nocardioides sp. BP30]|uniref:ABC transporter permease n=1 Tax=Nocardioides sp. BP30 TaxID=3036374 RepID=UPI0024689775|nr:ABC transporter permease [Nocardioides sp. BP30]WGL51710.1 ABC transporter permease [Nocardioides sp. BP30]
MSATTAQTPAPTPAPAPASTPARRRGQAWDTALVTVLSFVTALVISAVLIAISDKQTRDSLQYFAHYPGDTFRFAWSAIWHTYQALFYGAIFNPHTASNGTLSGYLGPISETLTNATPLIAGGLAVGVAFRAGLFNIGGQGQIIIGAVFAGFVGFHWHLPAGLHLIAAILAGILGGALWGGIAGFLKARTGAHEVITTIMLNYVAINLLGYLLSVKGFQAPPYGQAIANPVDHNATLPLLLGSSLRVHLGLILSLAAAALVWWLLKYSRLGFRLRAVGANPFAARTAGMHVENSYIVVMLISGALCGLAGVSQVLGTNPQITSDIDGGIGFDAITVALLGRANPVGTVFAGLLFGALRAGGPLMQQYAPIELVQVIQSLIVLFIAAPALIRAIYRLKTSGSSVGAELAKGWNG